MDDLSRARTIRAREKLTGATRLLAVMPEPLPERLRYAAKQLCALEPENFADEEDREEFEALVAELTAEPDRGDGTIASTVATLSQDEAQDLAQRILSLAADRYR